MKPSASSAVVFLARTDGRILTWSPECERLMGYAKAQATKLDLQHLVHTTDRSHVAGIALHGNFYLTCASGKIIPVLIRSQQHGVLRHAVFKYTIDKLVPPTPDVAGLTMADVIEGIPCLFYMLDETGCLLLWNRRFAEAVGVLPAEPARADVTTLFTPQDRPAIVAAMQSVLEHGSAHIEAFMPGPGGDRTPYLFHWARVNIAGETRIFGTGVNISERRTIEQRLRVTERAMDACVNAILITGCHGTSNLIEYVNPAFSSLTGYSQAEIVGRDPGFMKADLLDADERARVRHAIEARTSVHALLRNRRKSGDFFWNDLRIDPVVGPDGSVSHFVAVIQDVTQAKREEEQLRHLATHDAMTGLVNRAMLHDRLEIAIERARRDHSCIAVAYLDVDDFKIINDSFGHDVGDQVLKSIASRLSAAVRSGDTVARLGGDEFVAVINDCRGPDHVGEVVERIRASVIEAISIHGMEIVPSVSIGVSLSPHDGRDCHAILCAADSAMYCAKTTGKNQFKFYSRELDQTIHKHLESESRLRYAIDCDELLLVFQPKVDLRTGAITGAEALVRWNHPNEGLIMPNDFIHLAEESGLIVPLGEWVLERSCAVIRDIRTAGHIDFTLSVNLSARQLYNTDLVATVKRLLAQFGIASDAIELEVTEVQLMDNPDQAGETLARLKALGVRLSIDDFGTGYSNLSRLHKLPVDYLKIDRTFLSDLKCSDDAAVVQAIISTAHILHLKVIAEGVETIEQLQFLRELGCDQMQGSYFSAPVSQPELMNMLDSGVTLHAVDV